MRTSYPYPGLTLTLVVGRDLRIALAMYGLVGRIESIRGAVVAELQRSISAVAGAAMEPR